MELLSYQDYISKNYVEIDGMPNCIKNVELGHKVKRCNISASINIDQSSHEIVLFRISNNLYNSTYLINDLILHQNPENVKIVCKIKKKCKIYFLQNIVGSYQCNVYTPNIPPELLLKYETNTYDFTISDHMYSNATYQYYLHETNTPLEFTFMPNLICIFKFDNFEYINENDYITKNMIYQIKLLNITIKTDDRIDKKKIEKLEQDNSELKDHLKKTEKLEQTNTELSKRLKKIEEKLEQENSELKDHLKKTEKLEQENAELRERLKKIEEKLFMSVEHKYF
jgi:hypothetical protein